MFLLSAVTGAAFLGPETGRIGALSDEQGPEDPEVQARIARVVIDLPHRAHPAVLIVLDMVLKPGL